MSCEEKCTILHVILVENVVLYNEYGWRWSQNQGLKNNKNKTLKSTNMRGVR